MHDPYFLFLKKNKFNPIMIYKKPPCQDENIAPVGRTGNKQQNRTINNPTDKAFLFLDKFSFNIIQNIDKNIMKPNKPVSDNNSNI